MRLLTNYRNRRRRSDSTVVLVMDRSQTSRNVQPPCRACSRSITPCREGAMSPSLLLLFVDESWKVQPSNRACPRSIEIAGKERLSTCACYDFGLENCGRRDNCIGLAYRALKLTRKERPDSRTCRALITIIWKAHSSVTSLKVSDLGR